MIQLKQKLEVLAKQLNLTSSDESPDEYILTELEEQEAIGHAIKMAKNRYLDKHLELGDRLTEVEFKMSEIDWNLEIDKDAILKTSNANKNYEVWLKIKKAEEKEAEFKKRQELELKHTAKFFYNIMAWTSENVYRKTLVVNETNKHLITAICFFLSKDERFEKELGYSFNKGLLIRGVSGLGKTFLFQCVKDNQLNPIKIYSMIEIAEKVQEAGYMELPITSGITYLDDVGTEQPTVKHYGTEINFFKDFIEKYYLHNLQSNTFNRLIVSTNNNAAELQEKYGFRVRSRMKDMFNFIDIKGSDMRGN